MKANKLFKLFTYVVVLTIISFASCVEDSDFDVPIPSTTQNEPDLTGLNEISFEAVKAAYDQALVSGETTITFENDNYISGYVISSDQSGNFFEELYIQNSSNGDNPTNGNRMGIKIEVNAPSLYQSYEFGRKVYIKLNGLTAGISSGVLTLGKLDGNEVGQIQLYEYQDFILRSTEVVSIEPKKVTLASISELDVNTLIQLSSAQFNTNQLSLTFAGEANDEFDGERIIESCDAVGGSITMLSSTFSDFKSIQLPSNSGTLTAVLTKDFFGENKVVKINSMSDINFTDTDRCQASFLNPNITPNSTFINVKSLYEQAGDYVEFGTGSNLIIEGYVVSTDETGNFFKELFIQNTPEDSDIDSTNPRLGLRVSLDRNDLFENFQVGRKVYIKLDGLAINEDNGVLTIGYPNTTDIQRIPDGIIDNFVIPGEVIETLIPKVLSIDMLTSNDQSTLIQFDNMQFHRDALGLTYAAEPTDDFDGFRILEGCDNTSFTISLQTSTFASFKASSVNELKGSIKGIVSRDFDDAIDVLIINGLSDINFTSTDRCDPLELDCGLANAEGTTIVFEDDFETQTPFSSISGNGWTNHTEAGTVDWEAYTQTGSNSSQGVSARVGSFRSGDASSISWLITPEIDLDANSNVTLSFETSNSFSDGSSLDLLFSTDWDGTSAGITSATWGFLPAGYITQDTDSFASWFNSGIVDLSCGTGKIYIAFRYSGSGESDFDGTYELDNIKIASN